MAKAAFPARLRAARERAGLSVAELAERAQLGRTHVHQLESGYRGSIRPAYRTLQALAKALGCTLDELAG